MTSLILGSASMAAAQTWADAGLKVRGDYDFNAGRTTRYQAPVYQGAAPMMQAEGNRSFSYQPAPAQATVIDCPPSMPATTAQAPMAAPRRSFSYEPSMPAMAPSYPVYTSPTMRDSYYRGGWRDAGRKVRSDY